MYGIKIPLKNYHECRKCCFFQCDMYKTKSKLFEEEHILSSNVNRACYQASQQENSDYDFYITITIFT